jgi:phosphate transport system permease protein
MPLTPPALADSVAARARSTRRARLQDMAFEKLTGTFALLVLLALVGILISLAIRAWPAFDAFGLGFLVSDEWDIIDDRFGALLAIVGTLATSAIALVIAVPLSFGIALFLTETCPLWLRRPLGVCIELLAGVPSIIYGMFGLFIFAPLFAEYGQPALTSVFGVLPLIGQLFSGPQNGLGILTAGLILAVMILPFIASVMRDVFEIVPSVLKESAYGLGCTTWEVVTQIVLPYTRAGVIGGIMLGLGRALGETMAVTFVIGNAQRLATSFYSMGNSIASSLANEFAEADSALHVASLFALGLLLFVITFVVLSIAKLMLLRLAREQRGRRT